MADARTQRFPALDGVRALAALGVVLTHVGFTTSRSVRPDLFGAIIARGDFGVTVFFLLSGFLLYRPFAMRSFGVGPQPLIAEYLWRRALRILPALWLMTAITLAFVTTFRVRAVDWWHYLLLIHTYDHHDYDPNLSQLWTLVVEVSFYLLLPLLAATVGGPRRGPDAVLRRQAAMLGVLCAVALTFNLTVSHTRLTQTQALLWLPGYLDWFAAGMALAVLSAVPPGTTALAGVRTTARIWATNRGLCWLVSATLFLISTLPIGIPRTLAPATFWEWTTQHYIYGAAALFVMLPLVIGTGAGRADTLLGSRTARLFGNLSYSIYLWHVPVMLWLQRQFGYREFHGHFWPLLVATSAVTFVIAAASWFVVERPILRYGSRPWRGPEQAARTPAASAARHSN
jgi:peptidoglycan/LPS O-acetylase OafA/YrhL